MNKVVQFPDRSLIEEEAGIWIVRMEGDEEPSPEQVEEFQAWIKQSDIHREVLIELSESWTGMDVLSSLAVPLESKFTEGPIGLHYVKNIISAPCRLLAMLKALMQDSLKWRGGLLAGVFSLALVGIVIYASSGLDTGFSADDKFYATDIGEHEQYTLADGSVMWLNTDSRVEVAMSGAVRKIILHNGEAHFQVFSDKSRPFEVFAGSKMIRAVGTAFSVYLQERDVQVTVTEGKVALGVMTAKDSKANHNGRPSDGKGISMIGTMRSGQRTLLSVNSTTLGTVEQVARQDLTRGLAWRQGQLVFAGESLEEVIDEIARYSEIDIEFSSPEVKSIRVGGQFKVGELDALFDVLGSGFGVDVQKLDNGKVLIEMSKEI